MTPWDALILRRCDCGATAWLEGPEGGCSQMFKCAECEAEYVVHPGRRERMAGDLPARRG